MNFPSIFITGLLSGGLTCLAVQGGLLASSIAQQESDTLKDQALKGHAFPILIFLAFRLLAYTALGILLGSLGSVVQLSLTARVIMQTAAAIFMIGTALNMLDVHPIFRYFILQPPKFLTRLVRNQSKSKAVFGPAILGLMTVLIPCGTTQAMMALAITTSSPLLGGLTLFTFILGTSPLFFLLGYAAKKLTGTVGALFNKVAAVAIVFIALYNLNGAIALSGSSITFESILTNITCTISWCSNAQAKAASGEVVTQATIFFTSRGYRTDPEVTNIKAGSTVTIKLVNDDGAGCIQGFTIPKLGIQKIVRVGQSDSITFVAPNERGPMPFMCSMGMYRGIINVI